MTFVASVGDTAEDLKEVKRSTFWMSGGRLEASELALKDCPVAPARASKSCWKRLEGPKSEAWNEFAWRKVVFRLECPL